MRNISFLQKIGFGTLTLIVIGVLWIAEITHTNRNLSNPNQLIHFAIQNNFVILIALVVLSVGYGFLWSSLFYRELKKKEESTRSILQTVFMFLGEEEKSIIEFLVTNGGETTQSEISRLPGMSRVKAFRLIQKMQSKNLIEVSPHGKVRKIKLK